MKRRIIDTTDKNNIKIFTRDLRGSRDKFWFYFNENTSEKWLFKKTNIDDKNKIRTYEDIGEVVFYEICKSINVPCAYYELATNHTNEEDFEGVITKDYNPNNYIEFSGFSILDFYKNFIYDNYNGKQINVENTLDNYQKSLICFANSTNGLSINIEDLMLNLKKMFIIDYLSAQSDRNWYNISFLYDEKSGEFYMAPLFDNGNIFCWNHKESIIKHQLQVLKNKFKISYLNELLQSKTIALGIKTPTSIIDPNNPKKSLKLKQSDISMDTVEKELIEMIVNSKQLQDFVFSNFTEDNIILKNAFDEADKKYQGLPNFLYEQANLIFKLRCKFLTEKASEKLNENNMQEEEENETYL